jgi:hypothetical protein
VREGNRVRFDECATESGLLLLTGMASAAVGFHVSEAALDALARTVDHSAPNAAARRNPVLISDANRF